MDYAVMLVIYYSSIHRSTTLKCEKLKMESTKQMGDDVKICLSSYGIGVYYCTLAILSYNPSFQAVREML